MWSSCVQRADQAARFVIPLHRLQQVHKANIALFTAKISRAASTGIVDQIAQPMDITAFTISGGGAGKYLSSLLLPGTTRIDKEQENFDISARNASLELSTELRKKPDPILMYSVSYAGQLPMAGDLETHTPWNISPETTNNTEDYKKLIDALERTRILMDGRKFLIFGDFPGSSEYHTIYCIAQLRWFSNVLCSPQEPRSKNKAALHVNHVLRRYAQTHDNVYFIDPYDFLCTETHCKNLDETGMPIYSDSSHLSKTGSIYFFKRARAEILRIIGVQ